MGLREDIGSLFPGLMIFSNFPILQQPLDTSSTRVLCAAHQACLTYQAEIGIMDTVGKKDLTHVQPVSQKGT
jgi:hypothetical protein